MKCRNCKHYCCETCDLFPKLIISISTDWGNFCRYGRSKDDQKNQESNPAEDVEKLNAYAKTDRF